MRLQRSALFEEIRLRLKTESTREDVVALMTWLCTHFTDDGLLRSPQAARRATIVLSGTTYWLVRLPRTIETPDPRQEKRLP